MPSGVVQQPWERDEVRGEMGPYGPSEDFDAYTLSAMGSMREC